MTTGPRTYMLKRLEAGEDDRQASHCTKYILGR